MNRLLTFIQKCIDGVVSPRVALSRCDNRGPGMKKIILIAFLAVIAGRCAGLFAQDKAADAGGGRQMGGAVQDTSESGLRDSEGGDWKDPDSDRAKKLDDKTVDEGIEGRLKEYTSIRRKKNLFRFHMGFSIGAFGYGILGPRDSKEDIFKYKYEKGSFTVGFRGGLEALFYLQKRHCISAGLFFEQRIIQVRIIDVSMFTIVSGLPMGFLYGAPLRKYVDKSNIDTNYFTIPVLYRFHVLDEFYIGAGLDVGVLFYGRARYGVFLWSRKMDYARRLRPVDLGARMVFGFTMNRVFIEVGLGCGVLDYDRLPGERHSIYLTAMIGYRI